MRLRYPACGQPGVSERREVLEGFPKSQVSRLLDVPLRNLVAKLGVAAAADQLDLVCHFGGHGDKISAGAVGRQERRVSFLCCFLQLLAGNPAAGLSHASVAYGILERAGLNERGRGGLDLECNSGEVEDAASSIHGQRAYRQ